MPPVIARLLKKKLGALLVEEGVLKEDQLQEALKRQRGSGEGFIEILGVLGFLTEQDVARAVAKQFGLPYMDPTMYRIPKSAFEGVPVEMMRQNQFVVLDRIGKTLLVSVAGVLNAEVLEKLEKLSGAQAFIYVSTVSQVMTALDRNAPGNGQAAKPPVPGRK
jgi:type IV pilus assembly protein PilB